MSKAITDYLAGIGAKGGAAGTGKAKKRGTAAHYRELAKKSAAARRRNKKAKTKTAAEQE